MIAPALLLATMPLVTEARPRKEEKKVEKKSDKKSDKKTATKTSGKCAQQKPQNFLVRSTYVVNNNVLAAAHAKSIRYRIEQYGHVDGFGSADWNPHPPSFYAKTVSFFGHQLRMHEKAAPALQCVEQELKRACAGHPYQPQAVGGFRDYNSYRGGEITNHLFGLAIDIDPEKNPCCRCVEPWPDHPACKGDSKTIYQRMAMPKCWVDTFEKYGFYWLGHDKLQDTMHFEFLGRPEKIFRLARLSPFGFGWMRLSALVGCAFRLWLDAPFGVG
jgi:hypothetical protein